jgi:hypothetical protein
MIQDSKNWFDILVAARGLSEKGPFSSSDLAKAANLQETFPSVIEKGPKAGTMGKGSTPAKIASGWLSKFKKWGYAQVIEKVQTGAPTPTFAWRLTEAGMTAVPRDGVRVKLEKLLKASNALVAAKGKKTETEAWKAFVKTLEELSGGEEERKSDKTPQKGEF